MSYTPKQQGSSGSGSQQSQQAKTLAGITQQMQNLVHSQNALPQTSQAGLGAVNFANLNMTLQQQQQHQQRFESIFKTQQQLLFSAANPQIQQHFQQQIQQQQNAAKDLLNKSLQQHHQQQANGSTASASLASNLTNQQLHQQLQAFTQNPANLMQTLQAYQYQIQQQHQQKIMPLNQTQQSLTAGQLDVQNVTQQHMQQLQLQQQKLLASHTKNLPSSNQMKAPVTSGTSSVSISNASVQIQSNNNLPNKTPAKGTVVSITRPKQTNSPGPVKTPPIQTNKVHGTSANAPKPITISPSTVKPPPVIYPPKAQSAPVSLTRTSSTLPCSSPSRSPASIQQMSRSVSSPHPQAPPKAQTLPPNYPKAIANSDITNKAPKQIPAVAGKLDNTLHASQSPIVASTPTLEATVEAKKQESKKSESTCGKEKIAQNEQQQKQKVIQDSQDRSEKEPIKIENKETKETPEQKQEHDKNKEPHKQGGQPSTSVISDPPSSEKNSQSESSSAVVANKTENASEKPTQKIPLRAKPNQRRNIGKNEKEKLDKEKAEKLKTEKEKTCKEKVEKEQDEKVEKGEKDKIEKEKTELDRKEKLEIERLAKEKDGKEKHEKEKVEKNTVENKEKSNKEKILSNASQLLKNERKRNSSEKSAVKSGNTIQQSSSTLNSDERRSKRHRLKTILYQSPLPELAYITKLSVSETSNSPRSNEEKLTLFYKSEYLAVRNAEGGFFICQSLQNIYKSSKRIRIRWFSEEKKDSNIFNPDFYDNTDLECILTTVEMEKLRKDRFRLPKPERIRIENILKKAMDVEKGITPRPDITEENPDGLDISLLKTESQIARTPGRKRAISKSPKRSRVKSPRKKKSRQKKETDIDNENSSQEDENEEDDDDDDNDNDKEYKPSRKKSSVSMPTEHPKLRAQRSPLAKARKASPIPVKKGGVQQSNKSVPVKSTHEVKKEENIVEESSTVSTANKIERPKRKAVESVISYDEELVVAKRLAVAKQVKKEDSTSKVNDKDESDSPVTTVATATTITSDENQASSKTECTSVSKSDPTPAAAKVVTTGIATTTTGTGTATKAAIGKKKKLPLPSSTTSNTSAPSASNAEKDKTTSSDTTTSIVLSSSPSSSVAAASRLTRSRK